MASQKLQGNAFEYACLIAFYDKLKLTQDVQIQNTKAVIKAKDSFEHIDEIVQKNNIKAANAAFKEIIRLEPQLSLPNNNSPLLLDIQEDAKGQKGDVRDVLFIRKQNGWEIGLSCKHNHSAIKHSRLSKDIDFGQKWLGIPNSKEYFNKISPIFNKLSELQSQEVLWKDVEKKMERFYMPILEAFMDELKRIESQNEENIPYRLLNYLIGMNDFYKVMKLDKERTTHIQAFNINGTLNFASGGVSSDTKLKRSKMPTRFFNIDYKPKSKTTIEIHCDNGWGISMRIHSAETKVIPSLKFDINFIGNPSELYSHREGWE